jgi:RNA polymerase sigma-70 factor (ECF subfamily)
MERPSGDLDQEMKAHQSRQLETLAILIQQLKPLDRQVIIFYLEELDARSIAEITGLSTASVAMKIHRIKRILGQRVQEVQSS